MSLRSIIAAADHLALVNGLYYVGALAILEAEVRSAPPFGADGPAPWRLACAYGFVACLAISTYLLDRVKPGARFVDPADELAHPERHAFMLKHAFGVRLLCGALGVVAAALGGALAWPAVMVVGAAWGAVLFYGRPRGMGWRPKDVLVLKNLCVATAASALCVAAAAMLEPRHVAESWWWARVSGWGLVLGVIVFSDAVLCDIDDVAGDGPFGTRTVPVVGGTRAAWRTAEVCHVVAAASLSAGAIAGRASPWTALVVGGGLVLTNLLLRATSVRELRPWVDLRLGVLGAIVLMTV